MNAFAPSLPEPDSARWRPLRLGLIELYHYDAEEFWFDRGRLLLRGNNGTGKSKVLSLTLPFLLDANLSAARVEPDADRGKRMEWNLLMGGRYERRTGYTWIEFGRIEDGEPRYLTLGCGLRATAGRAGVDSWFFVSERRVGAALRLVTEQRTVLNRERLVEELGSHAVFDRARDYRRCVDEQLFSLGAERYGALIDTLIQLRQPQLSKQPNEANLSEALSAALPPLDRLVLEDVAEAMTQLDEQRGELADYRAMQDAVARFNQTYGRYARILARRRARELRQAQTAFDRASGDTRRAEDALRAAEQAVVQSEEALAVTRNHRAEVGGQVEALNASPEMRSAQALQKLHEEAERAAQNARAAAEECTRAERRHAEEADQLSRREEAARASRDALAGELETGRRRAAEAGIAEAHEHTLGELDAPDALAGAGADARRAVRDAQQALAARREEQIAQVRRRLDAVDAARAAHRQAQSERDARCADTEAAEAAVAGQREATHAAAAACVDAWGRFAERAAPVLPLDWPDIPETLADWVTSLDGACPLDSLADAAARRRHIELTERDSDVRQRQRADEEALELLRAEHAELSAGAQPGPPPPATRDADRAGRPGAPLWQCVDFAAPVSEAGRAGLEAALQASGLLDAWVTPDGELLAPDTQDVWLTRRRRQPHNLADYLSVAIDRGDAGARALDADTVAALLAGIAVGQDVGGDGDDGENEDAAAQAWISPDGRYRIGPLQGAWHKPVAEYIGFAAREAARRRRLAALDEEMTALRSRLEALAAERREVAQQRERLDALLAERPGADALRAAHAELGAAEKAAGRARERLAEAEAGLQSAHNALSRARDELELDAADAHLPAARAELDNTKAALDAYRLQLAGLHGAIRDHAGAITELSAQREREGRAGADRDRARSLAEEQHRHAGKTAARHRELQRSLGASAAEVLERLSALQTDYRNLQQRENDEQDALVAANKALGGAESEAKNCAARQQDMLEARTAAVADFRAFADTGLLRAAAPQLEVPDTAREWTVDPALTAARGAEQALQTVDDSDEDYKRVRERLSGEFTELERALSARGYRSFLEPGDHGSVVRVMFNQRQQAPDQLQALLEAEIGERQSLLSAKEREIIENHLELEVAAQLQQLMREADERMRGINAELDRRPTSTGVKFKLVWQPRDDDDGAALAGLVAVRKLLLHTSSDAWSAADRAAVGEFLQARIAAERERDDGVARIDQLARALDYRAWHQFRVQRWQDGKWRKLSGPASSGERALGLTVPLFAAASSHYGSAAATAPRLVMLDEAFAGIDDAARAHCMDLIREFDLDLVMTSEREWGCYAELPGVSICHLVRREGVDAVHVSRWRWNGRTREAAPEPVPALSAAQAGESGAGA